RGAIFSEQCVSHREACDRGSERPMFAPNEGADRRPGTVHLLVHVRFVDASQLPKLPHVLCDVAVLLLEAIEHQFDAQSSRWAAAEGNLADVFARLLLRIPTDALLNRVFAGVEQAFELRSHIFVLDLEFFHWRILGCLSSARTFGLGSEASLQNRPHLP